MTQSIEEIKYERLTQAINNCKTQESFEKIKQLIEAEPSALKITNKVGLRPLHETVFCEDDTFGLALCKLFLQHGADINHKELMGVTALQFAIQKQKENFVTFLITYPQIDLNLKNFYGTSPLMNALKQAKEPIMSLSAPRYQKSMRIIDHLLRANVDRTDINEVHYSLSDVLTTAPYLNIANDIQGLLNTIEKEELEKIAPLHSTFSTKIVAKKKQIKI